MASQDGDELWIAGEIRGLAGVLLHVDQHLARRIASEQRRTGSGWIEGVEDRRTKKLPRLISEPLLVALESSENQTPSNRFWNRIAEFLSRLQPQCYGILSVANASSCESP